MFFDKLFHEAARLTREGHLLEATAAVQRALSGATPSAAEPSPAHSRSMFRGLVDKVLPRPLTPRPRPAAEEKRPPTTESTSPLKAKVDSRRPTPSFEEHVFAHAAGSRRYKLFVPLGFEQTALPLIVMLHGCTQSPDDFAAGTGMNEWAQKRGFLVLYPAQAARSNSSKCWNWFVPRDQKRGAGEPALLADMTRHVIQTHPIDPRRVFVAGLSAGGAMADILGREYPDVFAAVGVHSGVPQGAADDVTSAFTAMQTGVAATSTRVNKVWRDMAEPMAGARDVQEVPVPTIVFHGDRDNTVHPSNGERVIQAALDATAHRGDLTTAREEAQWNGRRVTRTVHRRQGANSTAPSAAEHWLIHGAGHAWSGGRAAGSFTDASGPDASREMIRFFEEHPRR